MRKLMSLLQWLRLTRSYPNIFVSHRKNDCQAPQNHWRWHGLTQPIAFVLIAKSMTFRPPRRPPKHPHRGLPDPTRRVSDRLVSPAISYLFLVRFSFSFHTRYGCFDPFWNHHHSHAPLHRPQTPPRSYPGWLWKPDEEWFRYLVV